MQLVTIGFSHYCEKARWALDRYGLTYDEERTLPGMHLKAVKRHVPEGGRSDGVHFRVRAQVGGKSNPLFGRFLDPVAKEADREERTFDVTYESDVPWTLLLITDVGKQRDYKSDWSWWSDLRVEPQP